MLFAESLRRRSVSRVVSFTVESMTVTDLPVVVAYQFAVIQQARGQPGIGLTLQALLRDSAGESVFFLQLEPASVWKVRDACADLVVQHVDGYQRFLAKKHASHQLNYGDKFIRTLPASDAYGLFHRRKGELSVPPAFRTILHRENTGVFLESTPTPLGLVIRFSLTASTVLGWCFPDDLAFLLADSIDEAIWAAEWERDGSASATG